MKGLGKYIKKHGKHFTDELAYATSNKKWSSEEIDKGIQSRVYYNVTGSTLGDMVFMTNQTHQVKGWSKDKCIDCTLAVVGTFGEGECFAFEWLLEIISPDFDFTPYI